jgi:4-amino-4-deoxy-L-arabinose transferase-like glycosyltransferase
MKRAKDPKEYLLLVFAVALIARLWFNFSGSHVDVAFNSDAYEYLVDAQALQKWLMLPAQFWLNCLAACILPIDPQQLALIKETLSPVREMSMAGPVFPLYLLLSFSVFGQSIAASNAWAPLLVQSILTSLTCVLIALIGCICWDQKTGVVAGLIAALYPGFLVNSGRLYMESFACFLVCAILWLLTRALVEQPLRAVAAFLLGLATFSLQITRSVMVIFSVALVPVVFLLSLKRLRTNIALFSLGFFLLAAPWLMIQKLELGKASLLVNRHGHYNLFIGNNVESNGWLSYPYPHGRGIEEKGFFQLASEAFLKSPFHWCKLMLDKPARLFKMPWNDFRVAIGPVDFSGQVAIHQIILLLATLGASLAWFTPGQPGMGVDERKRILARSLVVAVFAFHMVYILFIGMARYALSAMPAVILFVAAGGTTMIRLSSSIATRRRVTLLFMAAALLFVVERINLVDPAARVFGASQAALWLMLDCLIKFASALFCLAMCLRLQRNSVRSVTAAPIVSVFLFVLALPSLCLPLRAHGRWYEWQQQLGSTEKAVEQTIHLTPADMQRLGKYQSYVIVNLARGIDLADRLKVTVNGVALDGPYMPSIALAQDLTALGGSLADRISYEPETVLNDMTYGADESNLDLRQWYLIPLGKAQLDEALRRGAGASGDLHIVLHKIGCPDNTIFGAYPMEREFSVIPSIARFSWEKALYGVENDQGFTDPSYDERIQIRPPIDMVAARPYIHILLSCNLRCSNEALKLLWRSDRRDFNYPSGAVLDARTMDKPTRDAQWLIRISGKMTANSVMKNKGLERCGTIGAGVVFLKADGRRLTYSSPWLPRHLADCQDGKRIDYCFPLMPSAIPARVESLIVYWQCDPKEMNSVKNGSVCLRNMQVSIYQLPDILTGAYSYYEIF